MAGVKTPLDEAHEVLMDIEGRLHALKTELPFSIGQLTTRVEKAKALIAQAAAPKLLVMLESSGLPKPPRLCVLGATAAVQVAVVVQDEKAGNSFQCEAAYPVVRKSELFEVACDMLASELQNGTVPLALVQQILS